MMLMSDFHVHSRHSFDGRSTLREFCDAALDAGIAEVCFTEHIEPHHPDTACDVPPVYADWLIELEEARRLYPALRLYAGIEIGDNAPFRKEIYAVLAALPLDYRLLSLHLVDGTDPQNMTFFHGRTQEAAYARYVACTLESVLNFEDYDGVAHLGYCGKFAPYPPETRPLRWRHAPDHIDLLLTHLAQTGRALEINTSGLRQTDSTIPGNDILRRFAELGGEFVVFGSDAHSASQIGFRFEDACNAAFDAGLRWGVRYVERKPQPYALKV
jgi:histidinol-phosphatase (PHP family)